MFTCFNIITIVSVAMVLAGCSTSTVKTTSPRSSDDFPLRVIDSHTHTRFDGKPERTSGIIVTQENYYRELTENRVFGSITHNSREGEGYLASTREHPVVNCVGIKIPPKYEKIEADLKSKHFRCIKIYLGYVHAYAYDAVYRPLYKLAEKYSVPVIFHTGDTYSVKGKLKFADPLTVDEVAVDFPNVTFVIAHIGNPWIASAAEVAYKNPNVYLDGSALLIGQLSSYSADGLEKYVLQPLRFAFGYVDNPTKLMFGTDWPLVGIRDYLTVFKQAIPKEHWDKVFYSNARKVFHLDELPE